MTQVGVSEAKAQFSRLVERAALGEEIVITKRGRPMARLVSLEAPRKPRVPGALQGQIRMSDDFDAPLPHDIATAFGADE